MLVSEKVISDSLKCTRSQVSWSLLFFVFIIRRRVIKYSRVLLRVRRQTESSISHGVCPSHFSTRQQWRGREHACGFALRLLIHTTHNYNSNSVTFLLKIVLVTQDEKTLTRLFCIRDVVCMEAGDTSSSVKVSGTSFHPQPNSRIMPWNYWQG